MKLHRLVFAILLVGISACSAGPGTSTPDLESISTTAPGNPSPAVETATATTTATPELAGVLPVTPTPAGMPAPGPSGPYFGQEPPGMEPEIFAPGFISSPDLSEYSGAFSPDGSEYYFYRYSRTTEAVLLYSKNVDGSWSLPEQLEVTEEYAAFEPYVTFDNQRLYFAWGYPVPAGQPRFPYFFVERTETGWSEPVYAGQGMFLSSSRDGQLYTTDMSSRAVDGKTYLARITLEDGVFADYERLEIETPWGNPAHPCIALDGSYILFDVGSGNHLFLSFRMADGTWGEPIDLTQHGFEPQAGGAYISPDGKYLFFSLDQDIWWVDIEVVEELRPAE